MRTTNTYNILLQFTAFCLLLPLSAPSVQAESNRSRSPQLSSFAEVERQLVRSSSSSNAADQANHEDDDCVIVTYWFNCHDADGNGVTHHYNSCSEAETIICNNVATIARNNCILVEIEIEDWINEISTILDPDGAADFCSDDSE